MRALLILVIASTFLNGCGSGNVRNQSVPESSRDSQAVALLDDGQYERAAMEFLKLADSDRDNSAYYQLSAARAYIHNRDYDQADAIINNLQLTPADTSLLPIRSILLAKIAMARHQPERAESLLNFKIPQNAKTDFISDWHATRAELFELQNRHLDAATARIILGPYLENPAEIQDNTNRIWNHLNALDLSAITRSAGSVEESLRPWIELAAISKSLISRKSDLEKAINNWAAAYPGHPANPLITAKIVASSTRFHTLPGQIALLLPQTGIYEGYSKRIRDGFLSAWFNEKTYKPVIRIYNADASNINEIYQYAVDDGADFIVGPLEKDAVKVLAQMQPAPPVRTLALNQIDPQDLLPANDMQLSTLPDLIQFGLPPEDEAREVAQRGILEGFSRVLIIAPTDDFGTRVYNAFSNEWTKLGGRILERVNYDPRTEDFITPVKQLLNIDSSEARIAMLRQRLGRNINVTSRLRSDADFIFMVAPNLTARQIVPHLRFFRADTIPIYTISNVYNGKPDPLVDIDLNGVEFVDMPWLINSTADIRRQISQSWQAASTTFPRYYAFGIDAFSLIQKIGQLAIDNNSKYPGQTGNLYLTKEGIIHRNLSWAKFVDGQPQPIEIGKLR